MQYLFGLNRAFLLCFLLATFAFGCAQTTSSEGKAFIGWASGQAIEIEALDLPLPDKALLSLRTAIGSATVVGIGESRHDTREQLLLKGLLVRHMIEDLGFRVFILEESCPHVEPLNHYVISGDGDLRRIMNDLAGWYLWDTEEMLELFQWMRQFNQGREADEMVRVFGMDITAPALGVFGVIKFLEDAGLEVGLNEQDLGLDLQQGDFWPATWERYASLSNDQRTELKGNHLKLSETLVAERTRLIASTSEKAYEHALFMAEIGRTGNDFFSSPDRTVGGEIREQGMAGAALWYLDNEVPGSKAIIWAHNLHVATSTFRMPELMDGTLSPMGIQMREALGDDYIAIGAAFGQGSYSSDLPPGQRLFERASTEVMDGALSEVGLSNFLLDIRNVENNSQEEKWLNQEREWRAQDAQSVLVPALSFDLVYFVKDISRLQPTPLALERYQSMRD